MVRVPCEPSVPSRKGHIAHVRSTDYFYNMIQHCTILAVGDIGRIFKHDMALRSRYTRYTRYIALCSAICSPTTMIMPPKGVTINHNGDRRGFGTISPHQVPSHLIDPCRGGSITLSLSYLADPRHNGGVLDDRIPIRVQSLPPTMAGDTGHNNTKAWNAEALLF